MKAKKVQERVQSAPAGDQRLGWYSGAAAALIAFFWAYSPAMHAPFVFDDTKQIFAMGRQSGSLWDWMRTPIATRAVAFPSRSIPPAGAG